jgi:hypothetical protein
MPRRVGAKVELYPGELYPRVGFIVIRPGSGLQPGLGNFMRTLAMRAGLVARLP